ASRMFIPSLSCDAGGRMTPPSHPTTRAASAANANHLVLDISASLRSPRRPHRCSAESCSALRPVVALVRSDYIALLEHLVYQPTNVTISVTCDPQGRDLVQSLKGTI